MNKGLSGPWLLSTITLVASGYCLLSFAGQAESLRLHAGEPAAAANQPSTVSPETVFFIPDQNIADLEGELGRLARLGENIFLNTKTYAGNYVGNDLRCSNCHLDAGRLAYSAPLWAAYIAYPSYRAKTRQVNTYSERLQGCFRYSMNGHEPPLGSEELLALETYSYVLAHGAPTGKELPGRGYLKLAAPAELNLDHGGEVFATKCALCHGPDGQGQKGNDGGPGFPPLWGDRSFNWGAGLAAVNTAAGFIKAFMPLGQGGSLSDADAWDVAAYVDSRDRPQDPRFNGSVGETRAKFHNSPLDFYGQVVDGHLAGSSPHETP